MARIRSWLRASRGAGVRAGGATAAIGTALAVGERDSGTRENRGKIGVEGLAEVPVCAIRVKSRAADQHGAFPLEIAGDVVVEHFAGLQVDDQGDLVCPCALWAGMPRGKPLWVIERIGDGGDLVAVAKCAAVDFDADDGVGTEFAQGAVEQELMNEELGKNAGPDQEKCRLGELSAGGTTAGKENPRPLRKKPEEKD